MSTITVELKPNNFSIDSTQQVVSVTNNPTTIQVLSNGTLTTNLTASNTDQIPEGTTNLYYTTARAQSAITAGTGVTVVNGQVSIGQAVNTNSNVTFNNLQLNGNTIKNSNGSNVIQFETGSNATAIVGNLYANSGIYLGNADGTPEILMNSQRYTATTTAANQVIDYFPKNYEQGAKYLLQISANGYFQMWEGMVLHDGTNTIITAYGDARTNANEDLATITAAINGTNCELRVTPKYANTSFRVMKTLMVI